MLKKIAIYILIATFVSTFVACNDDSEDSTEISSNVMVTSFTLAENDNVLNNLDSIFFTIDLVNAKIFNADSLPYGTNVSSLVVNIGTTGSSVAQLIIPNPDPNQDDQVIDYLASPSEAVNFSNGPVRFHIVATDGSTQRDYSISVNVHKIKPDSLSWDISSRNDLPSSNVLNKNISVQKAVTFKDMAVCISGNSSKYILSTNSNPTGLNWINKEISFPFSPNVNSLNATNDALFILDNEGMLYTSTDGLNWNSCNTKWHHIYGGYGDKLLGVKLIDESFYHVTYPETTTTLADKDCPISGTSQIVYYNNKWESSEQAFIMGGRRADGQCIGEMWGYDGTNWAQVSQNSIYPREDMTFFAYYAFGTNTNNWTITKYPTLIAFGGFDVEGYPGRNVFISFNMGLTWKLADSLMQLPDYIQSRGSAQALVFEKTMSDKSVYSTWEKYPSKTLPAYWEIYNPVCSRSSVSNTQWECPYIYLYGGYDKKNGTLYNDVWRGVINRLKFKPIV